jgi:hypothetical protein
MHLTLNDVDSMETHKMHTWTFSSGGQEGRGEDTTHFLKGSKTLLWPPLWPSLRGSLIYHKRRTWKKLALIATVRCYGVLFFYPKKANSGPTTMGILGRFSNRWYESDVLFIVNKKSTDMLTRR